MKNYILRTVVLLSLAVLVWGCGVSNIALNSSFWGNKEVKVGVAVAKYPVPGAFRSGSEGLLDAAINASAAGDLRSHLEALDISEFGTVVDSFVVKLNERGLKAKKIAQPIDLEKLSVFDAKSSKTTEKDMRPLAAQENIDVLILLSATKVGTTRNYYGFIPLGSPEGVCGCTGQMIDLKTNNLDWLAMIDESKVTVSVLGDWDQPPDFKNVTDAVHAAINKARKELATEFFEGKTK